MATWTAAAGGGNWNDNDTWEEGGGYPGAGDNAVLDSGSGNVTVNVASACMDITCTGYTGTLTLGADLTVYGSLLFVSGMTFTPSTYTVIFAATSSGKTITSGGKSFYDVTFNGSGGGWTLQDDLTQTRITTFTLGTLDLNGKTYTSPFSYPPITLGAGFTLNVGAGTFQGNGNASLVIPTGATVSATTGTIGRLAGLSVTGSGLIAISGAANITTFGTVSINSSNVGFSFGLSSFNIHYGPSSISSNQPFYNLNIGTTYAVNMTVTMNSNLTVTNNLTIAYKSGYTYTLSAGSYTLTVGGNFANGGAFTAGTGTVVFDTSAKVSTVSGSITFNVLQCVTPDKTVLFKAGETFTVADFDFAGTSGHLITLDTDTGAGTWTISDASGTNQVEYCDIHRSAATGGASWLAYTADGNVDGGGNSGWSFSGATSTGNMLLMFA